MRGDPLRKVVAREALRLSEVIQPSPAVDAWVTCEQLECGHHLIDFEGRKPQRRRCRQCGDEPPRARRTRSARAEAPPRPPSRTHADRVHAELQRLGRRCPVCGADIGEPCVARRRGHLAELAPGPHAARLD